MTGSDGITTFRIKYPNQASFWFQAWHHGREEHSIYMITEGRPLKYLDFYVSKPYLDVSRRKIHFFYVWHPRWECPIPKLGRRQIAWSLNQGIQSKRYNKPAPGTPQVQFSLVKNSAAMKNHTAAVIKNELPWKSAERSKILWLSILLILIWPMSLTKRNRWRNQSWRKEWVFAVKYLSAERWAPIIVVIADVGAMTSVKSKLWLPAIFFWTCGTLNLDFR